MVFAVVSSRIIVGIAFVTVLSMPVLTLIVHRLQCAQSVASSAIISPYLDMLRRDGVPVAIEKANETA